jgi:uncharacterized protein (DUF433 family)
MVAELKQHVELRGDDPYDAIIRNTNLKAALVAQFALGWGIDEAVENYNLSPAEIYAALAFYHDNLEGIRQHEKDIEQQFVYLREDSSKHLENLKQRQRNMKNKDN